MGGQLHIPKEDMLDKYKRWSALAAADDNDFVPIAMVLKDRFDELCGLIDAGWKVMLSHSDALLQSEVYRQRLPPPVTGPGPGPGTSIIMQTVRLSSNTSG